MSDKEQLNYDIIDNKEASRFELHVEGFIAFEDYEYFTTNAGEPGIAYLHTDVAKELGGRGIAGYFVKKLLDDAAAKKCDSDNLPLSHTGFTGVSGSGKSSLAFDTVYAEGQRRYVESLSAYARQFLEMQDKPDVESITGLSPAIAIDQKTTSRNPRSTVSTATEIYDYMRLLFARIGIPYSPETGKPIEKQTSSQMVQEILKLPENTKLYILSPIIRGQKGEHRKEFLTLQKQGYERVKIDGLIYEFDELPKIDKNKTHDVEVVVDRLVLDDELDNRLADSVENSLKLSDGLLYVEIVELPKDAESKHSEGDIIVF